MPLRLVRAASFTSAPQAELARAAGQYECSCGEVPRSANLAVAGRPHVAYNLLSFGSEKQSPGSTHPLHMVGQPIPGDFLFLEAFHAHSDLG